MSLLQPRESKTEPMLRIVLEQQQDDGAGIAVVQFDG